MTFGPALIDAILVGVALEFLGLTWWLMRRGQSRWIAPVFWFLASGAALMAALRSATIGASEVWILGALTISGLGHIAALALAARNLSR